MVQASKLGSVLCLVQDNHPQIMYDTMFVAESPPVMCHCSATVTDCSTLFSNGTLIFPSSMSITVSHAPHFSSDMSMLCAMPSDLPGLHAGQGPQQASQLIYCVEECVQAVGGQPEEPGGEAIRCGGLCATSPGRQEGQQMSAQHSTAQNNKPVLLVRKVYIVRAGRQISRTVG